MVVNDPVVGSVRTMLPVPSFASAGAVMLISFDDTASRAALIPATVAVMPGRNPIPRMVSGVPPSSPIRTGLTVCAYRTRA